MTPPQKKTKVDLGSTSSPTGARPTLNPTVSTVPRSTSPHSTTVLPSTASPELRPNIIPTNLSPPTGNTSRGKLSLHVPLDCIEDDEEARTAVTILLELLNAAAAAGGSPPNQRQESGKVPNSGLQGQESGVHTVTSSSTGAASSAGASTFFSIGSSSSIIVGASSSSADKLTEHIHQLSAYLAKKKLLPVKNPSEALVLRYLKINWEWGGKGFITPNCLDGVAIRRILRTGQIGYLSSNLEYDGSEILPRSLIDTGVIPFAIPHSPPPTLPLLSRIPQSTQSSPSLSTVVTTEIGAHVNIDLDLTLKDLAPAAAATSNPPPTGPN